MLNNIFNRNDENNKVKELIHNSSLFVAGFFFLLGLILPMPFEDGAWTIFHMVKGDWNSLNVIGLILFIILIITWIFICVVAFYATKIRTWRDLRNLIFQMQNLIPVTISSTLLEMIKELENMSKEERKTKQAEYVKRINATLGEFKENENKLMTETLGLLERERIKNKETEEKAKQWDALNKSIEDN